MINRMPGFGFIVAIVALIASVVLVSKNGRKSPDYEQSSIDDFQNHDR